MLANERFWVVLFSGQPRFRASGVEAGNRLGIRSDDNRDAGSERLRVAPPFLKLSEVARIQAGSEYLLSVISHCKDIHVRIRIALHRYPILFQSACI